MDILLDDKILKDKRPITQQPPGIYVSDSSVISLHYERYNLVSLYWDDHRITHHYYGDKSQIKSHVDLKRIFKSPTTFNNNILNMNIFDIVKFVSDRNYDYDDFIEDNYNLKTINDIPIHVDFSSPITKGKILYFYVKFTGVSKGTHGLYLRNCSFGVSKVSPTMSQYSDTSFAKDNMLIPLKFQLTDPIFNIQVNFNTIK